jgi:hypothetical protein
MSAKLCDAEATVPIHALGQKINDYNVAEDLMTLFGFDAEMSKWLFLRILCGKER